MRQILKLVAALAILGAGLTLACKETPATPRPPGPNYIVFLDLSLSLSDVQQQSMDAVIRRFSNSVPPRSHLIVFPLGGYVEKAGPLVERAFPDDKFAVDRSELSAMRQTLPSTLQIAARAFARDIKNPKFAQHTCVSDAIRQAEQVIRDRLSDERTEILFISDMLEDCPNSLLNGPISLEKTDIRPELARVRALPPTVSLADLRGASVTCVVPVSGPTPTKTKQPELEALRAFWAAVFSHCHHDEAAFRLGTLLPSRLLAPERASAVPASP
jgi:hypothetical protein